MSASLDPRSRPCSPPPPAGPDPAALARLITQVWFEIRAGQRPFWQLSPLIAPALRRRLLSQLPRRSTHRREPAPRIRRVVSRGPSELAHEVCVLVEQRGRVTAVAVRLERHHGVWRAVELTAPESGLDPLTTASQPSTDRPRDAFDEVLEEPLE